MLLDIGVRGRGNNIPIQPKQFLPINHVDFEAASAPRQIDIKDDEKISRPTTPEGGRRKALFQACCCGGAV